MVLIIKWQAQQMSLFLVMSASKNLSKCQNTTMAPVSTVQPSLNQEFLCTHKNFKMSLYTLNEKRKAETYFIWKAMHESISEWWKNSCRPAASLWYFLRVESPLWYLLISRHSNLDCFLCGDMTRLWLFFAI